MMLSLELERQADGRQAALVTVHDDFRYDAGFCEASIQHRDSEDEPWTEAATVPWQRGLTMQIEGLKTHVCCVAPW